MLLSGSTRDHGLVSSAVSIGGLEGCMQQSCQSQSWSELEGANRSASLSFKFMMLEPSISLPSRASGIALDWTGVGAENCCCAIA